MLHRSKTRWHGLWIGALALGLGAVLIAGCGGSDEGSGEGGGGEDFRVAVLLPGNVADQTYNADAKRTADAMEEELGISDVTVSQGVPVPDQANVYSQFANQGYDLVIGWGGQFTDGATAVADRFPDTQFLVTQSTAENGSNLNSVDEDYEQWQFVAGFVAASISETGTVGFVAGQCFPSTAARVHGARQGAEHADGNVKFVSTFTGDFEDPTKAQRASDTLVGQGADVLNVNFNNGVFGVIQAAENADSDVRLITEWTDNSDLAPDVIVSSVLTSQTEIVLPLVEQAMEGSLGGKHFQVSLPEDWGPAISNTELLPDDVYEEALEVQEQVVGGEIEVERNTNCPS